MSKSSSSESVNGSEIAIIGMAGRFPGAKNVDEYWRNLRDGVESISFFTDQELESAGIDPVLLRDPNYVKAKGVLEGTELFDASFFGFTPREAEIMDPQHRHFLECAWEALENAGYDPEGYGGLIGVFGGVGLNNYFLNNLYPNRALMESVGQFQTMIGNDKDFVTTRVSYKMNLRGPSVVVQTACSTSLVAVGQACQSLLSGECDMALAGASSINVPQKGGYLYQDGGINSPDGHCRAFDARAQGTVFSNAAGIVVLKRLEDALADGDCIHAVIKGAAMNNDGSFKVGYTAPSVDGQAKVIRTAQVMAEIEPESITYIETHGTATAMGDPIEIAALTQAFRAGTQKKGFCAIGSVKTNIGHADAAAGIAGLIKTILMLKNRMIPPSLHFEKPNPEIDFAQSPFYVNTRLSEWKADMFPRRAGVSSFGIGGTNAHIIVEEAPAIEASVRSRPWKLLLLSARTNNALDNATTTLVQHLKQHPEADLADVAYTLQTGRKVFNHRRIAVCQDHSDAVAVLETQTTERVSTSFQEPIDRDVVFMFTGQGSQYVNMGLELYKTESVFREQIDQCSEILQPYLSFDLRDILYPVEKNPEQSAQMLTQTYITQPALFTIEYALAKLWMSWGVTPAALVGHSIGEYVAACLAGVLSLKDALMLVAVRGRLMQELPGGSMLVVPLSEQEILPLLGTKLSLAVINGPSLCVVSGEKEAVEDLKRQLTAKNLACRYLQTSHAFHSEMMEPILAAFTEKVKQAGPKPPQIPFVSNVTGTWITPDEASDSGYWARHLRHTVRFSDCLQELMKKPNRVLLEVGPGQTFSVLVKQQLNKPNDHIVLSSIRHPKDAKSDSAFILNTLGKIWIAGIQVDWSGFYSEESRHRITLPTYPFERKRFWIESVSSTSAELMRHGKGPELQKENAIAATGTSAIRKNETESPVLRLKRDLEEASGSDLTNVSGSMTFLEMGFDSLFLTQWALILKKKYGTLLPVHRLFDDLATLSSVAKYIMEESPADSYLLTGLTGSSVEAHTAPFSALLLEKSNVEARIAVSGAETRNPVIEKLIAQQLQIISEFLNELGRTDASVKLREMAMSIGVGRSLAGREGKELDGKHKERIRLEPGIEREGKVIELTGHSLIETVPRTGHLTLSSGQQRLWYLNQLEPNSPVYNLPEAFRLKGGLDTGALERALNEIIRRHEVLRTTYQTGDSGPIQIISPSLHLLVPIIDFSNQPENDREGALDRYLQAEAWRPFDLFAGPLVRASIVKLADEEHVLFFMPHHSVFDGWSWALFQKELFGLYDAFVAGKSSPLPDLPIQYADFGCWQREWLKGKEVEPHLEYWRNKLSGKLPVLELPTDFPRPAFQPTRGSRETLHLSQNVVDSLTELGRKEGATFFMVMMSAFQTLLARYSGQEDIIVGSPITGRTRSEVSGLIGFFVNTLIFRTSVGGNPSFRDILRRVREVSLGAFTHQDLPFERLVEEVRPERDLSRTPIYQAMLNIIAGMMQQHGEIGDIQWDHHRIASKVAQTDFSLWVVDADEGLDLELEYFTDLYKSATIKRMLKHFEVMIHGVLADPDKRIGELPLLTKEELKQLEDWNLTKADYPHHACLHQLFEKQVEKTPNAIALSFEELTLTYRELNSRANQLANYLRKHNVGPDVIVGVCTERSLDMVVGILGILKAGGAYVPLDPAYPIDRIAFMLEDAAVPVLLTQISLLNVLPKQRGLTICLDAQWEEIARSSVSTLACETTSENLAYIIYTSGSTGRPKGAMIPHRAIVNHMMWMQSVFPLNETDCVLQKTPFSFDASVWEFYAPLFVGGRLAVAHPNIYQDMGYLVESINRHRVTILQLVPTLLKMLLETPEFKSCTSLRRVFCGGEALTRELAAKFYETLNAELCNLYGPTEVTIDSVFYPVPRENRGDIIPIGRPVANTQAHVLDANRQPVPIGMPGELYLGGIQVARGYRNRPELTSEKFISDTFSRDPDARLYRTGDRVRYLPDGNIEFLGRIDYQVKIRGFRIELGEIEGALGQHQDIHESVVMAKKDSRGDEVLVAYVVPKKTSILSTVELRSYLKHRLPDYMVPTSFVILTALPLTPNGKVDRKALPDPEAGRSDLDDSYIAPRNDLERSVADLWQTVLHLEKIGVNDDFFDLGGTSISVAHLIAKTNHAFSLKLPMRVIYEVRSVSKMALVIEETRIRDAADSGMQKKNRTDLADMIKMIG